MELVEKYYSEYEGKLFYDKLILFIIFVFVFVMVVEGENVVVVFCKIIGSINLSEVVFGIIWGDYGLNLGCNIIYGLDLIELV